MRSKRAAIVAVVAVAFISRAWFLLRSGSDWAQTLDGKYYLALARGLAHGCGFAPLNAHCGLPEVLRTPGYPLFLVPFTDHLRVAVLIQAVIATITCALVARFTEANFGRSAALIAASFVASDLAGISLSKMVMSETLFECLVAGALFAAIGKRAAISALLVTAAIFVRPVGLSLVPVCVLPMWGRRRGALVLVAIPAIFVMGWAARNYVRSGIFSFSVEGTANLFWYTAPAIMAMNTGPSDGAVEESLDQVESRFDGHSPWGAVTTPRGDRFMLWTALAQIVRHPIEVLVFTIDGFAEIAFVPYELKAGWRGLVVSKNIYDLLKLLSTGLQALLLAALWGGALRAIYLQPRDVHRWALLLAAIFLILPAAPFPGQITVARFRIPAMPFLAVLAGAGLTSTRILREPDCQPV